MHRACAAARLRSTAPAQAPGRTAGLRPLAETGEKVEEGEV